VLDSFVIRVAMLRFFVGEVFGRGIRMRCSARYARENRLCVCLKMCPTGDALRGWFRRNPSRCLRVSKPESTVSVIGSVGWVGVKYTESASS
jgi:hypothetical protein